MPWYMYECADCGAAVSRNVSVAHRDIAAVHREDPSCEGHLRRVAPARGPADHAWASTRRRFHRLEFLSNHPTAGRAAPREVAPPHGPAPSLGRAEVPPGARREADEAPGAWGDAVLGAVAAVLGAGEEARPLELLTRLFPTLPSLSLKLRLLSLAARSDAGSQAVAEPLAAALAEQVAAAPAAALALERRLLDLLLLAKRLGTLDAAALAERTRDDAVMLRLLRSALWWAPAGPDGDPGDPPRLSWLALEELVGEDLLRARVAELDAAPGGAWDAWDRLALDLAADRFREQRCSAPGGA